MFLFMVTDIFCNLIQILKHIKILCSLSLAWFLPPSSCVAALRGVAIQRQRVAAVRAGFPGAAAAFGPGHNPLQAAALAASAALPYAPWVISSASLDSNGLWWTTLKRRRSFVANISLAESFTMEKEMTDTQTTLGTECGLLILDNLFIFGLPHQVS